MQLRRLAFAVLPVVAAAGLGGLASRDAPQTYGRLRKPAWAPPAAVFGPVWSLLYTGIGVAGWRLYDAGSARTKRLHLTQLALNAAWPAAFFGAREKKISLAVILALDALVAGEVAAARGEDPTSAALLTPYLAWTGFATAVNAAVSEPA
jgi:tryptophan-rich sensory protein